MYVLALCGARKVTCEMVCEYSQRESDMHTFIAPQSLFFFALKRYVDTVRQRTTNASHGNKWKKAKNLIFLASQRDLLHYVSICIHAPKYIHEPQRQYVTLSPCTKTTCLSMSWLAYLTFVAPQRAVHTSPPQGGFFLNSIVVRGYSQRENDSCTSLVLLHRETFLMFVAAQRVGTYVTFGCVDTVRERATCARDFTCERERLAYVIFLGYMHICVRESVLDPRSSFFLDIYIYICVRERVYLIRVRHFSWIYTYTYVSTRECTLFALVIFLGYTHIYMCKRKTVHYSRSSFFLDIYIYICVRERATRAHHFS